MTQEQVNLYNITRGLRNASITLKEGALQELSTYSKKDTKATTLARKEALRQWIKDHDDNRPRYDAVINHLTLIAEGEIDKYITDNNLTPREVIATKEN